MAIPSEPKPRRPFSVTLLTVGVLSITAINLLRLVQAFRQWDFLAGFSGVSPLYLALTGLIWSAAGLPLGWGLWRGKRRARWATFGTALVYTLYYWLDRLLLVNKAQARRDWPFAAVVTLLLLTCIVWVLSRSKAKAFFGERHDR
jgi:hypothetical protein